MSRNKALMAALLPMMSLGMMVDLGSAKGKFDKTYRPSKPKVVGYDHKERTPEEKFKKWCHKQKIKERRKRKGCRKGGRI